MEKIIQYAIIVGIIFLCIISWSNFENINRIVIANSNLVSNSHFQASSLVGTKLKNMSIRQKISSMFILHTPSKDAATIKGFLDEHQPGGLIFMSDNIPSTLSELTTLTDKLQTNSSFPYLFAVDEEGGIVSRLADDNYPAAVDLKNMPVSATFDAFHLRSTLLNQIGLNLNFGIVADVTDDPNSFIYQRVFGGDPTLAGMRVAAAVSGSKGLSLSTLKHFPGHGAASSDSHNSIPTSTESFLNWQNLDMPSFQDGINTGADAVMFGHLRFSSVDDLPASLSPKWHDILRNDMKFNGLIVTDDMIMLQNSGKVQFSDPINNAVIAIKAGNDLLVYVLGNDRLVGGVEIGAIIDGVVSAVNDGRISLEQINNTCLRILRIKYALFQHLF